MNDMVYTLTIVIPVLLISMSAHEMMHAFTSFWLGDDTAYGQGRVSLNPMRHIDPIFTLALPLLLILTQSPVVFGAAKPVQVNFQRLKYGEIGGAIVGMVGPLTNLAIALLAAVVFHGLGLTSYGTLLYRIAGFTVLINVGLFVFNSIPWPPLDGSRLLYAFAPRPLQEFMESIERMGIVGLVLFIFLFLTLFQSVLANVINSLMGTLAPGFVQFLHL